VLTAELASKINGRYLRRGFGHTDSNAIPPELADFMIGDNCNTASVQPTSLVIAALDGSDYAPASIDNSAITMDGRDTPTPSSSVNLNKATAMDVSVDGTHVPECRLSTFSELDQEGDETTISRTALREVLAILGEFFNNINSQSSTYVAPNVQMPAPKPISLPVIGRRSQFSTRCPLSSRLLLRASPRLTLSFSLGLRWAYLVAGGFFC